MQRDEPELPGMRGRAGDDDAARLEQRAEPVGVRRHVSAAGDGVCAVGGASSISTSASTATGRPSTTISGFTSTDATSGRASASADKPGQHLQRARPGRPPARRGTAPSSFLRREVVDEVLRVLVGERHDPERDVAERLREHAADAEHHARPELRVAHHPGDELACSLHHRRDQELDGSVFGPGGREHLVCGGAHRVGVAQVQLHEAALGLVRDRVAVQLDDHWEADRVGGLGRGVCIGHDALVEHGHAVVAQQLLGRGFGEGRHRRRVPKHDWFQWSPRRATRAERRSSECNAVTA